MNDSTTFSCQVCGGPVAMLSLADFIPGPGRFINCPACGFGNPLVRKSLFHAYRPQVLLTPKGYSCDRNWGGWPICAQSCGNLPPVFMRFEGAQVAVG